MKKWKWSQSEIDAWMRKHNIFIYFNPMDKNIFIRKRYGIGWAMNLGNVYTYVLILGLFAVVFLISLLM